jgi:hypothetical protein
MCRQIFAMFDSVIPWGHGDWTRDNAVANPPDRMDETIQQSDSGSDEHRCKQQTRSACLHGIGKLLLECIGSQQKKSQGHKNSLAPEDPPGSAARC